MTFIARLALALALAAPAVPAFAEGGPSVVQPQAAGGDRRLHPDRQQEILARKVGRMILIGFAGDEPGEPMPAKVAALIGEARVGGVVLFGDNVRNPAQLRRLTGAFRAAAGSLPPVIAIDQEGGQIQRLTRRKGFVSLPGARAMARKDLHEACALYAATAAELAGLGVNVSFGPVVDLDVNPASPAIGRKGRAYARDPATVAAYARQFVEAHRRAGVLTSLKHFPGHGSAVADSHDRVTDVTRTWKEDELRPYDALVADGLADMVMVGHLTHPRFSDGDRPASLSRRTVEGELRRRLGFAGLIVTDDLGMGAVSRRYSVEEAALMAIRAGADLLIIANPDHPDPDVATRVGEAVAAAVAAGRIPARLVEEADARIAAARARLGVAQAGACPEPPPVAADAAAGETTGAVTE